MPPKTFRGAIRKAMSGDGRKNPSTAIRESMFGTGKKKK
jgi:hypothetical protein